MYDSALFDVSSISADCANRFTIGAFTEIFRNLSTESTPAIVIKSCFFAADEIKFSAGTVNGRKNPRHSDGGPEGERDREASVLEYSNLPECY